MTSFNVDEARKKILELTQNDSNISNRNVFKETLRQLKSIFGSLYYTDGNNNKIKINCTTGKQERAVAKLIQENNLVLPLITITENGISEDNSRLRNTNLLVHEVVWDPEEKRAKRTLSLPPRPINLSFTINIWTKYMEDMDMIRSNILSMFNPYLSIDTKFSDFTIAYMREEADIIDPTAADNTDRLVQKTITLTVQTYVPSPKFLYTNTGEIKAFKADVTIDSTTETLSLINPPASIPDEEYSSSGGPFNTGLTLSGSLDDVEIIEVNIGQVLAWNGSYWIPSSVAGVGGGNGTFDHQELNNRLVSGAHPQYVLSSTNLTLSSNVSAHIASASVHFTSGSLSGAYVLSSTNSSLSSLVSNLQTSTASISSVVNSHLASASVHFTSGSLSAAYVLSSTNNSLSSLVNEIATSATNLSSLLGQHIGSAVHWELSTLNQNYINASGDSANAGFYLSSVSATNISATNYYNLPSATIVWEAARDIVLLVRNGYASRTILKGDPVTVVSGTGNSGGIPIVQILSSVNTHVPDADLLSNHVAGLAREDIPAGAEGYIIIEGLLTGLDTDDFLVGDWLYVSSNGQLSNQRPTPPYESHPVGVVTRSQPNNGTILVKIENSPELNDIVGFNLNSTLIDGDIITYDLTTSTFVNKQTVNVSGLGKFGSVSATSVSSIHLSSTYVSANTILTNKLAVGGSDGYIYNPDGDLYISATNGKVKFNTGFEVTGTISGTSISATTYLNLPSGTATWNANQLQGRNVAANAPVNGDALVWNTSQSRWEPSSISTGGGSVTNNPGGSNGDIQFKNGASFSGVASVNYDSVTDKLNVTNFSAVNLTATNFTNAKLDDHIASASVHFTSGSLSGYYAGSAWADSRYVLSSVNNALSSQVNNLQASTASISSVVNSHINDSSIHFTSGSLSGYYAGSAWTDGRYVLTSINNALSGQVNDLQASTASISSVVNSHINDSSIHFTSGSLSGYYAGSAWADSRYVLSSVNNALSSQVNNLQASTASISSVVNSHINDSSIHFTSGSLSGYYAGSAWADSRYVLSSTNLALSSQVNNLQASTASISSVVNSHINDATIHFTSGSLSGYYAGSAWTDSRYVLSSTNLDLSSQVNNLQASTASISSVVNGHIGSAVHWELATLNANYINASGDSSNNGFYFSSLSSTRVSATNYINLPSGSEIWNAAQIGSIPIGETVQSPDSYHVIYYDSEATEWGTKSVKTLIDLGANFGLKDLIDVRASSVDPFSSVIFDGDPLVWDSNTSSWGSRNITNFAGNLAPELATYFVSAGGGTYLNSNYTVSSLRAASISGTTISATTYQNLPTSSLSGLLDVDSNSFPAANKYSIIYNSGTDLFEVRQLQFNDLYDYIVPGLVPSDNWVLAYNSIAPAGFTPKPLSDFVQLDTLNDVNAGSPITNDILQYIYDAGLDEYYWSSVQDPFINTVTANTISATTFLGGTFRELVSSIHSSSTQLVDVAPNCDSYLINTTTSAVTVRLPSASSNTGRTILVTKVEADGSHRGVTVSGYITDNQTSAVTMYDPNESIRFISNGVSWTNLDYQKSFGVVLVAKNNTSSLITKGTPLRLAGSDNNSPTIQPVSAVSGHVPDAIGDMPHCIGLAEHDFPPSSFGHVITRGLLYGIDTNSLITGDPVYINDNGQLTNMMPMAPFESIHVGIVVLGGTTTDGIIYVDLIHPMYINEITGFDVPDTIDDTPSASHYKAIYYTSATRTFTADYIDHGFLIGLGDNDHPQYASSSVSATINTISGNLDITTSNVNTVSTTLNSHIGSAVHWDLATLNSNYINASGDSSNNAFYFSSLSATTISATTYQNLPVSSLSGLADVLISSTPTTNYVLKWNGTKWAPASDNTGAGGGITDAFTIATDGTTSYEAVGADTLTLSSSDSSITVTQNLGLFNLVVNEPNVAHNSLSQLTTGDPHTQYALKSLSSTAYWNANKLQGIDVSTTTPTSNQALVYNGTASAWVPSSLPAGGGGGLTEGITAITDGIITYTLTGAETLQFESRDGSITWEVDYANNPTPVVAKISGDVQEGALTHNNLGGLTTGDPHTQYALKSLSSTAYWNANKLQGVNISSTAPTTNQALVYDGNGWIPSSLPAGGGGGVTFLSALSDVSAPTPTHKDILVYNSSVGRYVDTPIFPRSVAVHCDAGANITLTNQPNTEQFFANNSRNIFKADLTYFTQARICARVVTQSASVNNPRLYVEYATTFTTTVGSYLDIGVSPVSASLSSATYVVSNWVDLAAGAKADVFFTVLQNGGDGTADPALGPVSVEFR